MPIDEISPTNSILLAALQRQGRALAPSASTFNTGLNPTLGIVTENQALTPVQQTTLLVNETLQSLNFVPSSTAETLRINETNPTINTALETQNLSLTQQTDLAFNDTLQALGPLSTVLRNPISAAASGEGSQSLPSVAGVEANTVAATGVATALESQTLTLTTTSSSSTPSMATATATTTSVDEALNPSQTTAITQPILDRNLIAVPIYEIRDPKPLQADPKPRRKEILPAMPSGRVRPVDRLVLRQEWERRKERGQREEMPPRPPLAERSIRDMIQRANEDLAANGLPLHLVLAKNNDGYCLDIYDCSDEAVCRLSQEVHLDLNELLTILDNLQHETGIIINIKT